MFMEDECLAVCMGSLLYVSQMLDTTVHATSSSAKRVMSLGLTIFGEIFVYVTIFNPTIELVTFSLHGC